MLPRIFRLVVRNASNGVRNRRPDRPQLGRLLFSGRDTSLCSQSAHAPGAPDRLIPPCPKVPQTVPKSISKCGFRAPIPSTSEARHKLALLPVKLLAIDAL